MNRISIIWLFLFSAHFLKAQEFPCLGDSAFYKTIMTIIDKEGLTDSSALMIYQGVDSRCVIKRYAYIVDKMYELGLDLHSRLIENRWRDNDIIMYGPNEKPPPPKPVVKTYHKIDLFTDFMYHKEIFEYRFYHRRDDTLYLAYVDELVRYGSFTHPQQVREVLLFKYRALNREKLNDDYRDYLREKNRKKKAER